jgi:hypothetical protein
MEIDVSIHDLVESIDEVDLLQAGHLIMRRLTPGRKQSLIINQMMTESPAKRMEIMREVGVIPNSFAYDEVNRKLDEMIAMLEEVT